MSPRAPRKPRQAPKPPEPTTASDLAAEAIRGRKATVYVERAGAGIRVDDVPPAMAGVVLAEILNTFRELAKGHPELSEGPDTIPGGSPIYVPEDDDGWEERRRPRKVGF